MSHANTIPSPEAMARDQITFHLTPFFLDAAQGDPAMAKAAAQAMLDGYRTDTTEQLQLAAQIIAFSFAALDSLRRCAVEPTLPVPIQIRLRGNANAMNRSALQCRRALELRRKAGATPNVTMPETTTNTRGYTDADVAAAVQKAAEVIGYARSDLKSGKPMSYTRRMQENERLKRLAKRQAEALAKAAAPSAEAPVPAKTA